MTVTDENENITIFGKMDENVISEMVVLVGGEDNAMIYVKGGIDPILINGVIKTSDKDRLFSFNF